MRISDWSSDVCSSDLKAAVDEDALRRRSIGLENRDCARADRGHERRMARQNAEIALGAGHHHHMHVFRTQQLFGSDQFKTQLSHHCLASPSLTQDRKSVV